MTMSGIVSLLFQELMISNSFQVSILLGPIVIWLRLTLIIQNDLKIRGLQLKASLRACFST